MDNGYITADYLVENGYVTIYDHATPSNYGVVKYDNSTIVENVNSQLSVAGLADQRNNIRKIWVGLLSEYNLINPKDQNTFYIVTND